MSKIEEAKKAAAYSAIDTLVTPDTQVIGIGSGSTIAYSVERLGQLYALGKSRIKACIPSSFQAQQLILENKLPLGTLNQFPEIDICFDGADEVDSSLNCIKGGGGCHLQEKLIICNSKRFYIVADYTKESASLGTSWKKGVPLEVMPMAYVSIMNKLRAMGGNPKLRMATSKAGPCVTDNGNFIIDCDFGVITDPRSLNSKLIEVVGIIETGLFCGLANGVFYGLADGSTKSSLI